eukprot:Colp12_sorted_trinity150504_noHs@2407
MSSIPPPAEFTRGVTKRFVTKLCQRANFEGANNASLDTLSDVFERFISEIGKSAHGYAELASRTECNLYDIRGAFEDVYMDAGELLAYFSEIKDDTDNSKSYEDMNSVYEPALDLTPLLGELRRDFPPHIPKHCPPLPYEHTYQNTAVFQKREKDPCVLHQKKVRQRRQIEHSLSKLLTQTAASGTKPLLESSSSISTSQVFTCATSETYMMALDSRGDAPTAKQPNAPTTNPYVRAARALSVRDRTSSVV